MYIILEPVWYLANGIEMWYDTGNEKRDKP